MRFKGRGIILVVWLRVGFYLISVLALVFGQFGVVFGAGTRTSADTCSICIGISAAASKGSRLQRMNSDHQYSIPSPLPSIIKKDMGLGED